MEIQIILASASPRRRELLEMAGIEFRIVAPSGEEPVMNGSSPENAVTHIAMQKCIQVSSSAARDTLVIAADTLVCLYGHIMGKPRTQGEAAAMLTALSGKKHTVFTGVALFLNGAFKSDSVKTDVYFRELTHTEINNYISTGEPMDKAGAYGAQGRGALFIKRIEGEYSNVVGLPLCRLSGMLSEMGVNLL